MADSYVVDSKSQRRGLMAVRNAAQKDQVNRGTIQRETAAKQARDMPGVMNARDASGHDDKRARITRRWFAGSDLRHAAPWRQSSRSGWRQRRWETHRCRVDTGWGDRARGGRHPRPTASDR